MLTLIKNTKRITQENECLPFSVYSSAREQRILNVPIMKPLLIFVLAGHKRLGAQSEISCPAGEFIFLSNAPNIVMRNIPDDMEYFALLIEFDYQDFNFLESRAPQLKRYFKGPISSVLEHTLMQFIEWSTFSPPALWSLRRQEILQVLLHEGFIEVNSIIEPPTLSHQVHKLISADIEHNVGVESLSSVLAMSESTLRRKLSAEGTTFQAIKDRAKLGHGLHLVQTSATPIGLIAEQCGYSSQSRFTDKFKQLFGITPSELRKTRVRDLGE